MNAYQLLKQIKAICKENGWQLETRKGATSHQILYLTSDRGRFTAVLPMNRKPMGTGMKTQVIRNLNLKDYF